MKLKPPKLPKATTITTTIILIKMIGVAVVAGVALKIIYVTEEITNKIKNKMLPS